MVRRFNFRSLLIALATMLLVPLLVCAQIPHRIKRCLPYPSFADELSEISSGHSTVVVDSIEIIGGDTLPEGVRQQLLSPALPGGAFSEEWLREFAEVGIRGILQDAGYFKAVATAEGQIQASDTNSQHIAITLRVEEGHQYRLGSVNFRSVLETEPLIFGSETLRLRIPLKVGDLFDVSKIRKGMDLTRKLYLEKGYIDLTVEPQTDIDEDTGTIAITFILDQGMQYRVAKVEVWGPNPEAEKVLQSKWQVGSLFNADQMDLFFQENTSILPSDASPEQDVQVNRNTKEGTVDLKFDFRVCPAPQT